MILSIFYLAGDSSVILSTVYGSPRVICTSDLRGEVLSSCVHNWVLSGLKSVPLSGVLRILCLKVSCCCIFSLILPDPWLYNSVSPPSPDESSCSIFKEPYRSIPLFADGGKKSHNFYSMLSILQNKGIRSWDGLKSDGCLLLLHGQLKLMDEVPVKGVHQLRHVSVEFLTDVIKEKLFSYNY